MLFTTETSTKPSSTKETTPTTVSPITKKRFTALEPSPRPIDPKGNLESSFDDSTRETEESDDLSSRDDDDYITMGYVGNASEDVDGEKDNSLKTSYLSLAGQSSTEQATSETNSNYTYCYAEVKPRWNLNLNQESEYCYAEVNPIRKWNYKPELVECGLKIIEEEINGKRPSGYEEIIHSWEFNFPDCVNPKSIIKRNDRPLSTDSSIYVIPMVRSTRRKFIVCKRNPYENISWGKQYYENVFREISKGANTVHGECLDDDEYVEVGNPYQNIEKRQKNALLKSSSNEEMEAGMETAKPQLKNEDQQHTVGRQVRFLYLILLHCCRQKFRKNT